MGLATKRAFDWVDFVFSGEGDTSFSKLCGQLLEQGRDVRVSDLPEGVICAANMTELPPYKCIKKEGKSCQLRDTGSGLNLCSHVILNIY